MIEYRGALSEADIIAGMRLGSRVLPQGGTARDGLVWLGGALAVLPVWAYLSAPERNAESLWWLPFSLLCLAIWWRRRERSLQQWRKIAAISGEQSGRVTDSALEARLAGVDARIPWAFFSCQVAARGTILLLVGAHLQLVLAASQFQGDDAWRRACELITRHVPEPKGSSLLTRTILWVLLLTVVFLAWHFARIKK